MSESKAEYGIVMSRGGLKAIFHIDKSQVVTLCGKGTRDMKTTLRPISDVTCKSCRRSAEKQGLIAKEEGEN